MSYVEESVQGIETERPPEISGGVWIYLNISVPDCWLLWGLLTRGTGPLILLRDPIMVMHCCG